MEAHENGKLSQNETALYDRQIRLWGFEAQNRLKSSRLLLLGICGLGAEVAKNIVLSGIKSITIVDSKKVTEDDFGSQFFAARSMLGQNRATASVERLQKLNPNVQVVVNDEYPSVNDMDVEFLSGFDVVCATGCSRSQLQTLNDKCRQAGRKMLAGDVFGFHGYAFFDLLEHDYLTEVKEAVKNEASSQSADHHESGPTEAKRRKEETAKETETKTVENKMTFASFEESFSLADKDKLQKTCEGYFVSNILLAFLDEKGRRPDGQQYEEDVEELNKLRLSLMERLSLAPSAVREDFAQSVFSQLSPVCAIVGGILAQEYIKAVTHKDEPLNSLFLFNALDVHKCGIVERPA